MKPKRKARTVAVKPLPAAGSGAVAPADTTRAQFHALQVNQAELESQNEKLLQARDEMQSSLDRYSDLYDFAPVGNFTLTAAGVIVQVNLIGAALVGIDRSALLGRDFHALVPAELRADFQNFFRRIFASPARQTGDFALSHPHRKPCLVDLEARRRPDGRECRVAVMDITARKQTERDLAEKARLLDLTHDAVIVRDVEGRIRYWNRGAEELYGWSREEALGQVSHVLLKTEFATPVKQVTAELHRTGRWTGELVHIGRDGRRITVLVRKTLDRDRRGRAAWVLENITDITARKVAEDQVRVSEIRYRRLFEAAHDGVLLLDPATRKITDANPFMTRLLGYPHDQLVGKELFEIGLLKDEGASREMFIKLRRRHRVRYEDLPLKSRTGRHQEVEVVANLYEENGRAVIQCNIRDITARKLGEAALHASEVRYRTLFESIDEGFCVIELIFDPQGQPHDYRFLELNPSFEQQTGLRGALGRRMKELEPTTEGYWFELYGRVARTGEPVRYSNEMKGLNRWFDVYAFRLGAAESRTVAILFSNITERKKAENALRDTRAQVAAYAAQLADMVAVRTAQLTATNRRLENSVATVTRGREDYRSLLQESEFMQKKLRHLARQIISAQEDERREISRELHDEIVQTLVGINVELAALGAAAKIGGRALRAKIALTQRLVEQSVNAVHRFARELRPAVLDDLGLIPALHAYLNTVAGRKRLKLRLTAFAGVEALDSAHRTVLFRVVQEAITNVVRHAKAGAAEVVITRIEGAIRLEVRDDGRSFSVPQMLSTRTNKRLGLLGMRERVEMIGGTLLVESAPGRGTTVRAEIPFHPPAAAEIL